MCYLSTNGPNDIQLELVLFTLFSTCEPLDLPKDSPMKIAAEQNFMSLSPHPSSLWIPASIGFGESSCSPGFLPGNMTPTIHYKYHQHQRAKFPHCTTILSNATGRKGSNVYEVNLWLWQFAGSSLALGAKNGGFLWQTQRTVLLSSRQTALRVL